MPTRVARHEPRHRRTHSPRGMAKRTATNAEIGKPEGLPGTFHLAFFDPCAYWKGHHSTTVGAFHGQTSAFQATVRGNNSSHGCQSAKPGLAAEPDQSNQRFAS